MIWTPKPPEKRRFCVALMAQNEAGWLRLILPTLQQPFVDGIVILDGGSQDDTQAVAEDHGAFVAERPFDYDFAAHANALINVCEAYGFTMMLRLDPDELVFPSTLMRVRSTLEAVHEIVGLPRRHFWGDRLHVHADWYPDPQWRAWRLGCGVKYESTLKVHEIPSLNVPRRMLEHADIFHYGYTVKPSKRRYRAALYEAIQAGVPLPNESTFTDDTPLIAPTTLYTDEQPLDPYTIGIHAPESNRMDLWITPDPEGDRNVEYTWCQLFIPHGTGKTALDVGSGGVPILSQAALSRGYRVIAVDYESKNAPAGVEMRTGDLLTVDLPQSELIICCSTVEHIGLAGRYGVNEQDDDGDLKAMARMRDLLTDDGILVLTLPVGVDHVHSPMHRIYGCERLPRLLDGFDIIASAYWVKGIDGVWNPVARERALSTYSIAVSKHHWKGVYFALGGFVLKKKAV
jgi:hypothetical protein